MNQEVLDIIKTLEGFTPEQREYVFKHLRREFVIHRIEKKLGLSAEIILEAIDKDPSGLTYRMIRGIFAEATFSMEVVRKLKDWEDITPTGDLPYDNELRDKYGHVSIQVKLQRSKDQKPMSAKDALKRFKEDFLVVETQKTRGGIDPETKEDTRPYRFGEFDILAVCMQPSTGKWTDFMYTVGNWLIPNDKDSKLILKFQPVAQHPNDDWTNDFETCVKWYREQKKKTIAS